MDLNLESIMQIEMYEMQYSGIGVYDRLSNLQM